MYGKNLVFKTEAWTAAAAGRSWLIAEGRLDTLGCLITHRTDLDHIPEAYRVFEEAGQCGQVRGERGPSFGPEPPPPDGGLT